MNTKNILPFRVLALLDTALAALLYRALLWLDGLVIGPHHVRQPDAEPPHSPTEPEPVEFDTRMSNEEWIEAAITEALRKAKK
jgi:CRISPR/Cas system CMR subunit Cmr6 (Cas7 group RAMP superfamily)